MKYKLHCFAQSGNAYKVALMLSLCEADWEPVFVDFFNGGHLSDEFQALNDMSEVPVLEAGDLVLSQSGVILDYFLYCVFFVNSKKPVKPRLRVFCTPVL